MSKVSERASNPIINLIIDIASLNYFLDHGTKNSVICFFCRFSGAFSSTVWQSFAAFPRTYANKRDLCASGSSGRLTARGSSRDWRVEIYCTKRERLGSTQVCEYSTQHMCECHSAEQHDGIYWHSSPTWKCAWNTLVLCVLHTTLTNILIGALRTTRKHSIAFLC